MLLWESFLFDSSVQFPPTKAPGGWLSWMVVCPGYWKLWELTTFGPTSQDHDRDGSYLGKMKGATVDALGHARHSEREVPRGYERWGGPQPSWMQSVPGRPPGFKPFHA